MTGRCVLYIASAFPALTVTFIYREVNALERLGLEIRTISMNRPAEPSVSQEARPFLARTLYLDQVSLISKLWSAGVMLVRRPGRMRRCLAEIIKAQPMRGARDYARLVYHWIEACYIARALQQAPDHIHSHFVNGPTSLGMFLSLICGVPFSFTMHASMIWLDPIALATKLRLCSFCVSISEYNRGYVIQQYGDWLRDKIHVIHCGIDLTAIPDRKRPELPNGTLQILAVGQLNARKGFHVLLRACAELKRRGLRYRCAIVGDGEEGERLQVMRRALDLVEQVELAGAKTQEELIGYFRTADLFVLPCVISKDGWRDGIPVALMEAMMWRIPVVTTNVSGLPELVRNGETGLVVEPEDSGALADAIERLARAPHLRDRLARDGAIWVGREFNVDVSAKRLAALFGA